jgi:hypothetical protein
MKETKVFESSYRGFLTDYVKRYLPKDSRFWYKNILKDGYSANHAENEWYTKNNWDENLHLYVTPDGSVYSVFETIRDSRDADGNWEGKWTAQAVLLDDASVPKKGEKDGWICESEGDSNPPYRINAQYPSWERIPTNSELKG